MKAYEKCKTCTNTWHLSHSTPDEMYNPCMHCCYEPSKILFMEDGAELMGSDNYDQIVENTK
jgi:hypothetical protein